MSSNDKTAELGTQQVVLVADNQIADAALVTVNSSGVLDLANRMIGPLPCPPAWSQPAPAR